jgi:hypothetical protein
MVWDPEADFVSFCPQYGEVASEGDLPFDIVDMLNECSLKC